MRTFIARRQINELNKYMMKLFGVTYGLMHWKCDAYAMHTKNEINTKKNMKFFFNCACDSLIIRFGCYESLKFDNITHLTSTNSMQ